ncbi:hypothetical protein BLNAU_7247 [Blattamonas nauphoetae]|uniref:Uncharacterized protein n=1 Tax=Blattamonas nauphoetae TaxID=2049346 RepID=A0ABQ9Y246_9EUKA|nr:hypothetical protein BLNAU_7247 [Blattamonas nauphoetae]
MNDESVSSNTSIDSCLRNSRESHSKINPLQEQFLNFDPNSELSFEDKSAIYCSLVALVKAEYPFDNALQDKTARFLKNLEPKWGDKQAADRLVTDLVPCSAGSPSGFTESILTLFSSPHSTVVAATLSFINRSTKESSPTIQCRLMKSDLIPNILATVQPQTLSVTGNDTRLDNLIRIIRSFLYLAYPPLLRKLDITAAVDAFNHREIIFQKVVLPSSQFVTFLISNRHVLDEERSYSFMSLWCTHITIGPFHRPTLSFIAVSPIVMAISSYLSSDEHCSRLRTTLLKINTSIFQWKKEGPEVVKCGKRMM